MGISSAKVILISPKSVQILIHGLFAFDSIVLYESREPERYIDPAMIGILVGMAIMFIIICVVLRLFSR